MTTLALSSRATAPVVASGGQTAFAANFPALPVGGPYQGLYVRQTRGGVLTLLDLTGFAVTAASSGGFTAVLNVAAQAGDIIQVYGQLPAERDIALAPGGAVLSEILEEDAMLTTARIQELRRDLAAAIAGTLPPGTLPSGPYATRVAAAAAHVTVGTPFLSTAGYAAAGDGGGAMYAPTGAAGPGGFQSADGQWWAPVASDGQVDARVFGLVADGATDNHAAALVAVAFAAGAGAVLVLAAGAGLYKFATATNFTCPVRFQGGAISATAAITVTFSGGFAAADHGQIFHLSGGANIVFSTAAMPIGYPEWWGAVTGGPDCLAALEACVAACAETRLQPADYWISATWKIVTGNRRVTGVSKNADGAKPATRVIVESGTLDCIQIGPDAQPVDDNHFLPNMEVCWLTATRSIAPTPPVAGFLGGPAGVRCQWLLSSQIHDIECKENYYGYYLTGMVYTKFSNCHYSRIFAGSTGVNDGFAGFFLDYSPLGVGNGGNASLYITDCGGETNVALALPSINAGLYSYNGFVDLFIAAFETAGAATGLSFNGDPTHPYSAEDLIVTRCVLDQCSVAGIAVTGNSAPNGAVAISYNYVGLAPGTPTGILIWMNFIGSASLIGNQVIGASVAANIGLQVNGSAGVVALGNIYTDCTQPVLLIGANNCQISDKILNANYPATPAAISLVNSNRNVIDCVLEAAAGMCAKGVLMNAAGNAYNEVRCSGLDPSFITGGSANKLVSNGVQIVAAGAFAGNNLAQGIMA